MTAESNEHEEETIRTAAYFIWLAEGQPDGRHELHWERARKELSEGGRQTARRSGAAKSTATKRARPSSSAAKKAPAKKAPAKTAAKTAARTAAART
ncbi:DUF2934 domain-containing protein [Acidimangrovimonas pyrenivorans]|uniref:DUF2934 domain-containing protein n=1 Tax=Acidimangrovimonas pyrenivorans TaxID=2030798 RepID=A0ABV7AFY6_9RHOB